MQTLILSFERFLLNSSQLRQTVLWNVSCQSSTDLELFPLERDRPLGTSVGRSHWALSGRWGAVVAARAYGDGSHQDQTSASWLWSWEWPDSVSRSQEALPSTWLFIALAVKSAVPCFFPLEKVGEWKEASQRLLLPSRSKITVTRCQCQANVTLINNIDCLKISKSSGLFIGTHENGCMFICYAFVEFNCELCAICWDLLLVFAACLLLPRNAPLVLQALVNQLATLTATALCKG